jgi:beta-phosphoglucomutase-like phosphatase (HAD superfamily)
LAQVVHAPATQRDEVPHGATVIELLDARVRITVASGTDRAMLTMILDVLDRRGR